MADKITVNNYFPCAKAPFEDGSHRLWTETNITNIFKSIFDVDTTQKPIISYDGKYLIIGGYIFEAVGGTWAEGNYYVEMDGNELKYDAENTAVLYSTTTGLTNPVGGKAQKAKIQSSSIADIDLNA